ncbi:hypothetical protein ACFVTZ_10465 [Cellulosimicrobium cellulans]|uniref:hypothetical protein n=1 Tax=Cellulosimicrobium cellulans TaxID=1710 RepID=UPI0036EF88EF
MNALDTPKNERREAMDDWDSYWSRPSIINTIALQAREAALATTGLAVSVTIAMVVVGAFYPISRILVNAPIIAAILVAGYYWILSILAPDVKFGRLSRWLVSAPVEICLCGLGVLIALAIGN